MADHIPHSVDQQHREEVKTAASLEAGYEMRSREERKQGVQFFCAAHPGIRYPVRK